MSKHTRKYQARLTRVKKKHRWTTDHHEADHHGSRNHPDSRSPWQQITLTADHPDSRSPWQQITLTADHLDSRSPWQQITLTADQPDSRPYRKYISFIVTKTIDSKFFTNAATILLHANTHKHACMHAHTGTCAHSHTHTHTHARTHTRVMCTCMRTHKRHTHQDPAVNWPLCEQQWSTILVLYIRFVISFHLLLMLSNMADSCGSCFRMSSPRKMFCKQRTSCTPHRHSNNQRNISSAWHQQTSISFLSFLFLPHTDIATTKETLQVLDTNKHPFHFSPFSFSLPQT